jgi:hypothetical protein
VDAFALSDWWPVIAIAVASLAVFSAPGFHTARLLGFDAVDSVCLAPALGYTYLLTAGLGATLLGFSWTPLTAGLFFVATWMVGTTVARLLAQRWRSTGSPPAHAALGVRSLLALGVLLLIAAAATAGAIVAGARSPEAIPQLGDTLFHLQAVQLLATTQDANFFAAGNAVWYSPLQYPGGFHVLASTLDSWTNLSTSAASHAALLVFCAAVWPLGMTFLVRAVLGSRGHWVLAGPQLAVRIQNVPA